MRFRVWVWGSGFRAESELTVLKIVNPELIGYVDQKAFICIVIGSVIAAPVGVKIAHSVSPALLKRVFGILLAAVSTKMIVDVLGLSN